MTQTELDKLKGNLEKVGDFATQASEKQLLPLYQSSRAFKRSERVRGPHSNH